MFKPAEHMCILNYIVERLYKEDVSIEAEVAPLNSSTRGVCSDTYGYEIHVFDGVEYRVSIVTNKLGSNKVTVYNKKGYKNSLRKHNTFKVKVSSGTDLDRIINEIIDFVDYTKEEV